MKERFSSGAPWESVVGYSRAVRVGQSIWVSGSTAANIDGSVAHPGDAYAQAAHALEVIAKVLGDAGASLDDVVRTRIYVTDISLWKEVGRAHGQCFAEIRPATTMVEVSRLIHPEMLVEIEAEAHLEWEE